MADPPGGSEGDLEGDANNDGSRSSDDDEFIEFVNTGNSDLDISNWIIEDAGGTTHTFSDPTILKPLQAVVVFGGGSPSGEFGGALVQTTGSLSLSNTGDDIVLKNDSGIEIINYTYGSEGEDNQSLTRNPDLSGNFEKHTTADTEDGTAFSPGTRIDGSTFQPSVTISGDAGWRLLSFPVTGGTVEDISDNTAIQGITGGDNPDNDANIILYKSGTDFGTPTNASTAIGDGYGFAVYFYNNSVAGSSPLPITLDAFGSEPSSDVTVDLNDADDYTLVGNPYASNYDLSQVSAAGGTIQNVIHFWDDNNNTYVEQDRTTPFIVSDWQGFWVESQDGAESITFPTSGKTSDSATQSYFAKAKQQKADIHFTLSSDQSLDKAIRLSFREQALEGWDVDDASKFIPMVANYATMAFVGTDDKPQSVLSLPMDIDESYEISLRESIVGIEKGTYTFSWEGLETVPQDFEVLLHDYETGETLNMRDYSEYVFEAEATTMPKQIAQSFSERPVARIQKAKTEEAGRFGISVISGTSVSNEEVAEPQKFALDQNYPNPFNPVTNIKYSIAESGPVQLSIFNVMGQKVTDLVAEDMNPGTYQVSWDASNMASGVYYYRLQTNAEVLTRQMTLIK
ncbi:Por secretion system C-terminal sorting domain-containing protein [Gracilimonas mengyeensis]|uniref:Por secretion system C-terminal sorting domain-containing protein n=1 Tax=Gracilimonas mengyeensis TaxID=1302730 RepID=A0A521DQL1_9BACT|nr:Por secretion system C-terminal sorting domain-containing protein [Gracilimonas mengyeensis]